MTEERRVLLHLFLCDSSERDRRRSSTVVVVQIKPEHALLSTWYLSRGLGRTRTCKNTEGIFKTGIKKKKSRRPSSGPASSCRERNVWEKGEGMKN